MKRETCLDVTQETMWYAHAEWATTADGRVVWVDAWDDRSTGEKAPAPKSNTCAYGNKPRKGRKDWAGRLGYDGYGETKGFVTNSARISVYTTTASVPAPPAKCAHLSTIG